MNKIEKNILMHTKKKKILRMSETGVTKPFGKYQYTASRGVSSFQGDLSLVLTFRMGEMSRKSLHLYSQG